MVDESLESVDAIRPNTTWSFKATLALVLATFGWAMAPVFIRLCSGDFDPFTQAFVRYLSGSAMLGLICLFRWRKEFLRLLKNPFHLLGISALNVVQQYAWTAGCYGTPATSAQLIMKFNVVFVILFAFFLFEEERAVIRDWRFLFGTAISLLGLVFILMKDATSLVPVLDRATYLLLLTSLTWAIYVVWGKQLSWRMHPVPMFAVLSLQTAVGLGILAFTFGTPSSATHISSGVWFIAVVSGCISIGMAHPAFQYAQREIGSALCTGINLINPLFTFLFSLMLLPGERMLPQQWIGAAVLIAGMAFVMWAGRKDRLIELSTEGPE